MWVKKTIEGRACARGLRTTIRARKRRVASVHDRPNPDRDPLHNRCPRGGCRVWEGMEGVLRKRETRAVTANIRWARKYVVSDGTSISYFSQTSRKEVDRKKAKPRKTLAHRACVLHPNCPDAGVGHAFGIEEKKTGYKLYFACEQPADTKRWLDHFAAVMPSQLDEAVENASLTYVKIFSMEEAGEVRVWCCRARGRGQRRRTVKRSRERLPTPPLFTHMHPRSLLSSTPNLPRLSQISWSNLPPELETELTAARDVLTQAADQGNTAAQRDLADM